MDNKKNVFRIIIFKVLIVILSVMLALFILNTVRINIKRPNMRDVIDEIKYYHGK